MSLQYTLLGFLSYGPMTGYELKRHIDASTQDLWHASFSQIYPTLQKMEKSGWVTSSEAEQEGKPNRKYYQITSMGHSEFRGWLDQGIQGIARRKNANMLKLFFAGSLPKERILHHLRTELDLQRQRLVVYEQSTGDYIKNIVTATGLSREALMWESVNRLGIEQTRTMINWLNETMQRVEGEYNDSD